MITNFDIFCYYRYDEGRPIFREDSYERFSDA